MRSSFFQKLINNKTFQFWSFILPAFLGTMIFIIVPIFASFGLSFTKWNLLSAPKWVGIENYKTLLSSPEFWLIFKNSATFAISTTVIAVILPLFFAAILNTKIKFSNFFKTAYFLPFITPMIIVAIVWEWIFDPQMGLMNFFFRTNLNWLYDKNLAMLAVIIVSSWKLIGYNMLIFISGFGLINENIYESGKIDGANFWATFFCLTLPLLSPTIFFVILITTISSFQSFDIIYLMTQGGPENSTNILVYWLYQNAFEYFNVGKASAIAYILFGMIFILSIIQWQIRKKWVFNED